MQTAFQLQHYLTTTVKRLEASQLRSRHSPRVNQKQQLRYQTQLAAFLQQQEHYTRLYREETQETQAVFKVQQHKFSLWSHLRVERFPLSLLVHWTRVTQHRLYQ